MRGQSLALYLYVVVAPIIIPVADIYSGYILFISRRSFYNEICCLRIYSLRLNANAWVIRTVLASSCCFPPPRCSSDRPSLAFDFSASHCKP